MKKRMAIMIIALLIVFGGIFGWNIIRGMLIKHYISTYEPPPVTISASYAESKTWQPHLNAIGRFVAVNGVDISAEAAGIVSEIYFTSGETVEQGKLLVKLDDDVDQATLKDNQAALDLARVTYKRQTDLFSRNATPGSEVDAARAQLQQAEAALAKTKAQIEQKYITAPFSGKLGIRQINLGEYINPGQTTIVTLQSLDPMFLKFFMPEQYLKDLYIGQPVTLSVDGYENQTFQGKITAVNSKIDEQTHNIEVQATIPNPNEQLYPGMFADIRVLLPVKENVVTVPDTAVDYSLYGDSIFVITADGEDSEGNDILKAHRKFVVTGEQRENEVIIKHGIDPGDHVVDSGQLKLDNGTRVRVDNRIKLEKQRVIGEEIKPRNDESIHQEMNDDLINIDNP